MSSSHSRPRMTRTNSPSGSTGDCAIHAHVLRKLLIDDVAAGDDSGKHEKQLTLTLIKPTSGSHIKAHHNR